VTDEEATTHLTRLANAYWELVLGPRGVAAEITAEAHAYHALSHDRAQLERLEPELIEVVERGGPAAVLYAALLLKKLGRDVAPMLAPYSDDRRELTLYGGGCKYRSIWLAEGVHFVAGDEYWVHPDRATTMGKEQRERHLWALEKATWFELPTASARALGVNAVAGRDFDGAWVRDFLALLAVSEREKRERQRSIARLAGQNTPSAGRLYGALLLATFDRPAADEVFDMIARRTDSVPWHERKRGPIAWAMRAVGARAFRVVQRPALVAAVDVRRLA
jgi:hypothetical protein